MWIYEKTPRMGGASGATYRNPLAVSRLSIQDLVSREAIQNGDDATVG